MAKVVSTGKYIVVNTLNKILVNNLTLYFKELEKDKLNQKLLEERNFKML